jgi:hypothetical protein
MEPSNIGEEPNLAISAVERHPPVESAATRRGPAAERAAADRAACSPSSARTIRTARSRIFAASGFRHRSLPIKPILPNPGASGQCGAVRCSSGITVRRTTSFAFFHDRPGVRSIAFGVDTWSKVASLRSAPTPRRRRFRRRRCTIRPRRRERGPSVAFRNGPEAQEVRRNRAKRSPARPIRSGLSGGIPKGFAISDRGNRHPWAK